MLDELPDPPSVANPDGPVLTCLADVRPECVRFLWQGRIALGKLNIVAGDPGLGKSYLSLDVVARVTTGRDWPDGGAPDPGPVVILTAEDGLADTVRPRLDTLRANVARVQALTAVRRADSDAEQTFSLAEDVGRLETAIRDTGAVLVVIDPLNAYLSGVDSHKAADVRSVMAPLGAMAERTGAAVLLVHHLNKAAGANALYRAGGSLDIVAAARSVLGVAPDPERDGRRLLLTVKLNIAAKPDGIGFRIDPTGVVYDDEPVTVDASTAFTSTARTPDESSALAEAKAFLEDQLSFGPPVAAGAIRELARDAGISDRTLDRAKVALAVESKRVGGLGASGAWCWQLPQTLRTPEMPKAPIPQT